MNIRPLALLVGLAALALVGSTFPPVSAETSCVDLPNGITACGSVTVEPFVSSATAEATATGSVTWVLTLTTSGSCGAEHTATGVAYAGTVRSCSAGCAYGTLTADDIQVAYDGLC